MWYYIIKGRYRLPESFPPFVSGGAKMFIGGFVMAYSIGEECIGCGACVDACPVGAISMDDAKATISADACIDCGSCAATCPVEAPKAE